MATPGEELDQVTNIWFSTALVCSSNIPEQLQDLEEWLPTLSYIAEYRDRAQIVIIIWPAGSTFV